MEIGNFDWDFISNWLYYGQITKSSEAVTPVCYPGSYIIKHPCNILSNVWIYSCQSMIFISQEPS